MLNKTNFTIVILLYLIMYLVVILLKPNFIFDIENDTLRSFGVGYLNKTILPLWLVAILLAIISYFIVIVINHIIYNNIFIQV